MCVGGGGGVGMKIVVLYTLKRRDRMEMSFQRLLKITLGIVSLTTQFLRAVRFCTMALGDGDISLTWDKTVTS